MNELKVFEQREILNKSFRIFGNLDNPLFLAKDVAEWIEHSDVSTMLRAVDENEKVTNIVCTPGGNQTSWFVTEDGLYEILMQSRKPIAKEFKTKVKEILKDIRRHGLYMTDNLLEKTLENPDFLINILTQYKEEKSKNLILSRQVIEMQPKVEYFDNLVNRKLLTNFRDTALELSISQNDFIDWLLKKNYIYRKQSKNPNKPGKLQAYSQYVPSLFEIKEFGTDRYANNQTLITPKGKETFRLLLQKDGLINQPKFQTKEIEVIQ